MAFPPRGCALQRRYGKARAVRKRGRSHVHGQGHEPRPVSRMLAAQDAPTRPAPKMSMREQILWDRQLAAVREAEKDR